MCGIAGAVRLGNEAVLQQMSNVMTYRGPDDYGSFHDGDVHLVHRRLSILDLSAAGRQPMMSNDGDLVITYNGEIYNFLELRSELERSGFRFRSHTDTEIILYAYRRFGLDFISRLEGMFAFGIWDRTGKRLILGRDRLGIKPLFYYLNDGGIAFASELKPLLCLPGLKREINRRAVHSAMRYASNLEEESMVRNIHKLRPGMLLVWSDGQTTKQLYWSQPAPAPPGCDEAKLTRKLRCCLEKAVDSHMIGDVPVGAALSGGLDSSAVVALMAREGRPVNTFTVGHGADDPDLINARIVAEHCRTNHHEIMVQAESIADLIPRVVWHLEEPLGQMESIQMYQNYREAARFVKVLLIGEGADECFAGYARYKLLHSHLPLPFSTRRDLYQRVYMYADRAPRSTLARIMSTALWGTPAASPVLDRSPLCTPSFDPRSAERVMQDALTHDRATYLHDLSLKRADALGMAHSLELRVPFLDRSVVEFAAGIPAPLLVKGSMEKYLLRRAVSSLLPKKIVWRRKRGFQMRLGLGLVDVLENLWDLLLQPQDVRARGLFDPQRLGQLRRSRPGIHATPMAHKVWSYRVWAVLLCEIWARIFIDRPISAAPPRALAELL